MRLILILSTLHFLAFVDRTMIGGVLPALRASVAMTDAQAGWIMGPAFALPYGVAALGVAALLRGKRASQGWLVGGVLLWTGGCVAMGLAGSLGDLTAARAALGAGQGIFVPVAIARLLDAAAAAGRGRALGIFVGSATAGRSTALLTVGAGLWALSAYAANSGIEPWRWLFVATALPNLLALAALRANRAAGPVIDDRDPAITVDWHGLLPHFFVAVAPVLLAQSVLSWLPTLFVRQHALSPTDAALLVGGVTLIAAPSGPVLAGMLASRYRKHEAQISWFVLLALATTLVPLIALVRSTELAGSAVSLAALLLMLGMALFGGLFGVQLAIPPHSRASVNGVYLAFATAVGLGLGPLTTGALASMTNGDRSLGSALLTTATLAVCLCAIAVVAARRPRSRRLLS